MKRSHWKTLLIAVLCIALTLTSLVGCKSATKEETPAPEKTAETGSDSVKRGDTLTVVAAADVSNLDPNDWDNQNHLQVTNQIYETLFRYDEAHENLVPWLCESYEYADDCTILIHLRKDVKFHNGDTLKASDVIFTFRRIIENTLGGITNVVNLDIDKCEAVDDTTAKLVTKGPIATQLALLENPQSAIISERAYTEAKGDFMAGACVGTGAFKYNTYYPGDRIELDAFDGYWIEGQPYYDHLTFRFISDSSSRAIEAETLGADIVYNIDARNIDIVDAADGVHIVSALGTNTTYFFLNSAIKPLDDIRVREAIFYAVDPASVVQLVYGNYGSAAEGFVAPGIVGYDAAIKEKYFVKRDVEKAKALLAEAGYPNGIDVEIAQGSHSQERLDMAEAFQAQMAEANIRVTLKPMEASTWNSYILDNKQNMMTFYGLSCADFEADRMLNQLLPADVNYTIATFDNAEFQALVTKANSTIDKAERESLYKQAIEILAQNYVLMPIWHKELNAAVSDKIEGFYITRSYEHHYLQQVRPK